MNISRLQFITGTLLAPLAALLGRKVGRAKEVEHMPVERTGLAQASWDSQYIKKGEGDWVWVNGYQLEEYTYTFTLNVTDHNLAKGELISKRMQENSGKATEWHFIKSINLT